MQMRGPNVSRAHRAPRAYGHEDQEQKQPDDMQIFESLLFRAPILGQYGERTRNRQQRDAVVVCNHVRLLADLLISAAGSPAT